MSRKSD